MTTTSITRTAIAAALMALAGACGPGVDLSEDAGFDTAEGGFCWQTLGGDNGIVACTLAGRTPTNRCVYTCIPGWTVCPSAGFGASASNLSTSRSNCGVCGRVCNQTLRCVNGICTR